MLEVGRRLPPIARRQGGSTEEVLALDRAVLVVNHQLRAGRPTGPASPDFGSALGRKAPGRSRSPGLLHAPAPVWRGYDVVCALGHSTILARCLGPPLDNDRELTAGGTEQINASWFPADPPKLQESPQPPPWVVREVASSMSWAAACAGVSRLPRTRASVPVFADGTTCWSDTEAAASAQPEPGQSGTVRVVRRRSAGT